MYSMIRCPNCKQRVKDYYDIKICARCGKGICPRCSVTLRNGAPICYKCSGMKKGKFFRTLENINYVCQSFMYFMFGPKWAEKPKLPIERDENEYY
jgi:hypothetical protein